jgi:hypothetical protein
MRRPIRKCVKCGSVLKPEHVVAAGPFSCTVCHTQLQAAGSYTQLIGWGSVLFPALLLAGVGLRGLRLLVAVLVAFVPVLYVATNFIKYLFPPRIELYLPEDGTLRLKNGPH